MITSTIGRLGYVTLTAGAFVLVALFVDSLYNGSNEMGYSIAALGLALGLTGFMLLMRDPYAKTRGWRIIWATPFNSTRGKWSQFPIYFSLFTLTNALV